MAAVMTQNADTNYLTVKDLRTNTTIRVPIDLKTNTIPGTAFAQLKIKPTVPPADDPNDKVPIRLYDPGFKNTTVCRSKVSCVDGENGKLFYRGYDVEELVEKSNYLEVAFLLVYGELPTADEYQHWADAVMTHTYVHSELEKQMMTFRYDAHPHGMLISTIASLSTFHPEANPALRGLDLYMLPKVAAGQKKTEQEEEKAKDVRAARNRAVFRMFGKVPTIAANVYRHRLGRPYNHPMPNSTNYTENILYMMDKLNEPNYKPDPRLVKILDTMFILLAEHGSNCSTVMMRHLMSSGVDPYTALSGAAGALFGERKATEVIDMLKQIGKVEKIQLFLTKVKRKDSSVGVSPTQRADRPLRLMGFGHRVYRHGDPRVRIAKKMAFQLFDLMGKDHIANLAIALEEAAGADEWFIKRGLHANVDFWTAIVFHTLRFPTDMFPVLMTVPRVAGFVANCWESLDDPEYKIFRPRQIYIGEVIRHYRPTLTRRMTNSMPSLEAQYRGSDPVAAKRRGTADPNTLAEIDDLITRTQDSLEELNQKLVEIETAGPQSPSTDETGLGSRVSTWVSSRFFSNPSGVGLTLQLTERLRQTQAELTNLLSMQRELIMAERQEEEQDHTHLAPVPERRASAKSPKLRSGNSTPRPIATSTPEPSS
ncbi:hypothetical protein PhCBS80983_g01809 [Powellomyces hirtus]|uniref:Citrate synthase n=1 Tax=Powellomyces hirtus TaxID=109895 RepID=A0A507EBE3_9FUNG|nr:hypothetical protein PhCBS80983_g01809 [Powellomyces hirtus]